MSLSPRQLAKIRELGRTCNELELRHEARRAAISTQRDYLATLNRKLEQLPRTRDAAIRDATTPEQHDAAVSRQRKEEDRLREEILTARAELEQLQDQLSAITQISAPRRELLDRLLKSFNLSRHDAGVAFGDDSRGPRETISLGAG
ncbi:MAG: hypothetical protein R3E75_08160 [Steroidobacteraceae bacterium]|nr:hypothetical protein [Nevskiaceae bacterium]MCP5359887.1 hypothetical protein [Nevskiaceae bacterium]MCP5472293.1 hypothetical protein [Nevskiaceae bacterium]